MTAQLRVNILRAIAILIFIAATSVLIHPAHAEDATNSTRPTPFIKGRPAPILPPQIKRTTLADQIGDLRERIASKEAALKAKLDSFKDQRKAQIAERVNTNLNSISQKMATQMQDYLSKLSDLVAKLETRVNTGAPDIKDPLATKAAIADARAAIATASAAVTAQSQKDYTITVTSETQVKASAQKQRDALKTDLTSLRNLVMIARQSVSHAIQVAKSETTVKEATPSGQQ